MTRSRIVPIGVLLLFVVRPPLRARDCERRTVTPDRPVTLSVDVRPRNVDALSGTTGVARLVIEDVEAPDEADVALRVFVDAPKASRHTATSDSHYAGSLVPSHGRSTMVVNLVRTLKRLSLQSGRGTDRIDVTIVAVSLSGTAREPRRVQFGCVRLDTKE